MATLIRSGNHQRPMLAVLERYNIGSSDKYGRGRWITKADLPCIEEGMLSDKTLFTVQGKNYVNGTNRHNHVCIDDFTRQVI